MHQPEKDEKGKIVTDSKGKPKSDSSLKDIENVPMRRDKACLVLCDEYFKREVLPFAPDAWYDKTKMKVGYEIAFNKYFYQYEGLRSLQAIAADILILEQETDYLHKRCAQCLLFWGLKRGHYPDRERRQSAIHVQLG